MDFATGMRYMYLARVLVGDYAMGKKGLLVPPSKQNPNDPTDAFDTVVDQNPNPKIFVTFYDWQCYPEYLIAFKWKLFFILRAIHGALSLSLCVFFFFLSLIVVCIFQLFSVGYLVFLKCFFYLLIFFFWAQLLFQNKRKIVQNNYKQLLWQKREKASYLVWSRLNIHCFMPNWCCRDKTI